MVKSKLISTSDLLTIFYDGNCPMCSAEMQHLKRSDSDHLIELVNLHQSDFSEQYPHINVDDAMRILHGSYQGKLLLGLEVTHRAWTLVGKGFWVAPLNWPVVKPVSHWVYCWVAKYRHPISAFLSKVFGIGHQQCESGVCYDKPTGANNRRK